MKALQTQFDDRRLSNAVATPTCSSCCCCCCCLATSIASSTLLAQRIGKEGEKHQVHNRHLLTVLAALFVPITGALIYFGTWTISELLKSCTTRSFSGLSGGESYEVCTDPGSAAVWPLLVVVPFLVLLYLYARVKIERPALRAVLVTILIAIAFVAEAIAGATMILTGVGGIVYLILVPFIVGWITVWYHRHLGKEKSESVPAPINMVSGTSVPSPVNMYPAYPPAKVKSPNEQQAEAPEEPPQQNPPAPGA